MATNPRQGPPMDPVGPRPAGSAPAKQVVDITPSKRLGSKLQVLERRQGRST